jgi:hypothetical protein
MLNRTDVDRTKTKALRKDDHILGSHHQISVSDKEVIDGTLSSEVGLTQLSPLFDPVKIKAEDHGERRGSHPGLTSREFGQFFSSLRVSNQDDGKGLDISSGWSLIGDIDQLFNDGFGNLLIFEDPNRPSFHHQIIKIHWFSFPYLTLTLFLY